MSRERFYRHSLWLPIAVPLVFGGLALLLRSDALLLVTVPALTGLAYGGFGYIPFALFVSHRWRSRDALAIEREFWLLPFYFAPFAAISALLVTWRSIDGWIAVLWTVGNYGFFGSLLLGYLYLGLVRVVAARLPSKPEGARAISGAPDT